MSNCLINQNQYQRHENENIILINGIKYEKIDKIGSGSEGVIYGGINVQTKQKVAIKESYLCDQRMISTLQTIIQKNCSHIIGIFGFQQTQNQGLIIVMEQASGEFYQFMKENEFQKMSYAEKNSLFLQMVQGVQQLHQLGLFHRDLKPENFVYINTQNNKKTIKLIDFGLVKQISNQLRNTCKVGTPYYMAPEVNGNYGLFYNKSVDIWSLGAIWYEMLVGQLFFKSTQDILSYITKCTQEQIDLQIEQNQQIQQKEKQFIKKMLRKDHQSRLNLQDILAAYNSNGQQIFQVFKPLINKQEEQKIQDDARSQITIHNSKYQEQIGEIRRDLERKIEQELKVKYEKLQEDYKKGLENQIKEKQNEIKEQQEKAQKYENDIQQITQMKIQQEIQLQIQMDQFKKQKDAEYNNQIEKLKQEANIEKEQKIQEQATELEKNLRLQIEHKYLLEYNQKVTQMEQQQELEYQKQLKEKRQILLNNLQLQQDTIKSFIDQLTAQQQTLMDLNRQGNQQEQLTSQINNEIEQNNKKISIIIQAQQEIELLQTQESLQEYENKLVREYQISITEQFNVINQISVQLNAIEKQLGCKQQIEQQQQEREQQLKKLKTNYQTQFKISLQNFQSTSSNMKKIKEKMQIYEKIQFDFQEKGHIQDIIKLDQKIMSDLQMLKEKENCIDKFEQQQQIIQYQSLFCKLEDLQQPLSQLKKSTQDSIESIEKIDANFINKQQILIDDLQVQLNDYRDKFKYLSKDQKYEQQIQKIFNQIEDSEANQKKLNNILNKEIFSNYQQFNQTYDSIQQQLQFFQKQHCDISEQIQLDEQIKQRNAKRKQVFETTQTKLSNSIDKWSNLKNEFRNLFINQDQITTQTESTIKEKIENIDQKISEYKNLFQSCQQVDKQGSCETSNIKLNELEQFQERLKQQLDNETENLTRLYLLIKEQQSMNQNDQQKMKLFQLNTQLQSLFIQFEKDIKSIKIECESHEFLNKMNEKTGQLQKTLAEQNNTLSCYFDEFCENEELSKGLFIDIEQRKGTFKIQMKDLLEQQQKNSMKAGGELQVLINSLKEKSKNIQFIPLNNKLMETYEYLQKQDLELSEEILQINSTMSHQLHPSQLNQLKEQIQKAISKLDELKKQLPQDNEIQEFNKIFKSNLESYYTLYALVNYIKQFHITKYYERIKEYANRQKKKQMNQSDYVKSFQKKQEEELEENTKKEKEAQDLLYRYKNMLYNDQIKKMIEEMEEDQLQMDKIFVELDISIKQITSVKIKGSIKNQDIIKKLQKSGNYKKRKFTQFLEYNIIFSKIQN